MATKEDPKEIAATDKAYEAATEAVPAKPDPAVPALETVTEPKPATPVPAQPIKAKAPKPAKPVAVKPVVAKAKPKAIVKPARKIGTVKVIAPKPAAKVAAKKAKPAAKPAAFAPKAAKTAFNTAFAGLFTNFIPKDTTMDMSANFTGFQTAITDAQAKAKAAFEKGTTVLGEVTDFTKGNVEAVVESGKILAEGVQGLGSELVAEGRTAFEAITGDIKELAAAKSPTDFFKIQSEMMRKSFDSAVAYGSKNSEVMLKLMTDAMAPISGRVSIAMEKARSTSL